jgi:hypothetical protein
MTYDGGDHYVLFFGGDTAYVRTGDLSGTWTFQAGQWTQLFPSAHPAAREYEFLANDQADGYVLLFGGINVYVGNDGAAYSDTWRFHAGAWKQLFPSHHPSARYGGTMSYDSHDNYALLFGGENVSGGLYGDTWTYVGGIWTHLFPSPHPSNRALQGMTFDSAVPYVLLFGGKNDGAAAQGYLDDTWTFSGGAWTRPG